MMVSARVVKTCSTPLRAADVVGKPERTPSLLPIQLACMVRTRSGQPGMLVERRQQIVGVGRDLEVVHRDFALLDQRAGAPAAAVDDLLVGEHGLVHGIPVDHAGLSDRRCPFPACAGTATGSSGSTRAGRWRVRGSSRGQTQATSAAASCSAILSQRPLAPAARRWPWRRSRPAGRTHPNPWAAAHSCRSCA